MEILKLSCIGRSTQPIKDLLEEVYREHKDKEKSLTIIRRPFGVHYGRNGWSRISQKPRYVDAICNLLQYYLNCPYPLVAFSLTMSALLQEGLAQAFDRTLHASDVETSPTAMLPPLPLTPAY
jgi:BCS1 N terminal